MGRYYHLSKTVTDSEATEIVSQMNQLDDVSDVAFTDDHNYLRVTTKDDKFSDVMDHAVNICSRAARGVELSFQRFAYEEA